MSIEKTEIAVNRYAPSGAESISLYSNGLASGLSLGQLIASTCLRTAAALEAQSIVKMNIVSKGSATLDEASTWLERLAAGRANWSLARAFLTGTMGIAASDLPSSVDSYDDRMAAIAALKSKMDLLAQQQQQDVIDLQTAVNRRDVAYSTSSNTIRALGVSMNSNAANF
ncbi:MAG: hypothetical protein K6F50_04450 [Kiritimatiellae bacterium]|nr:hypothetical protein [Kiritimatiellia bacterium]